MGMAAGQARLLSITSRMSDNELRAQIINNQKMRLATQSSQVSEAYTTALNDAKLMFTNYDADNNSTYQQLTFNALTAYNPYNNQYGLSNASGQILVSEADAINFKNANGDLNTFLGYYGLEYTTTYFDNLNEYKMEDGTIPYTGFDTEGNSASISSDLTAEQLQAYYEGIEGSIHPGYNTTIAGEDYYNFTSAMTNLNDAYTTWSATIANNMDNVFDNLQINGKTPSQLREEINATNDVNTLKTTLENLKTFINGTYASYTVSGDEDVKEYLSSLTEQIDSAVTGQTKYEKTDGETQLIYDGSGNPAILTFSGTGSGENEDIWKIEKTVDQITGIESYKLFLMEYNDSTDEEEWVEKTGASITNGSSGTLDISYQTQDDEGGSFTVSFSGIPDAFNGASTDNYTIIETNPVDADSLKEAAIEILKSLEQSVYNVWNPTNEAFKGTNSTEYKNYIEKVQALINTVFPGGPATPISEEEYPNLFDTDFLVSRMNPEQKNRFQPILDVLILDEIMNTYGEPQYAWIDTSAVTDSYNENGDAKAQWYTNLFNRMQDGYQVLQDGLASSTEWIEFALENGIVTLEQVDSSNNWNTTIYSNCSDITEQTDSVAITIAEAEYNAAMNKIENKDKMYDLELKNIDTEHNSLETEYESIKSAIDKNIERTFKIYS